MSIIHLAPGSSLSAPAAVIRGSGPTANIVLCGAPSDFRGELRNYRQLQDKDGIVNAQTTQMTLPFNSYYIYQPNPVAKSFSFTCQAK